MTMEISEEPQPSVSPPPKVSRTDEDVGGVIRGACANIFANPDQASLKRLAWAYGCAKKDSDEERRLLELLVDRMNREKMIA